MVGVSTAQNVAILYDLLSKSTPLTHDQTTTLQTTLRNNGIDTGIIDGDMGKNTSAAIIEFLRDDEHKHFAAQVSPTMVKQLHRFGQGNEIDRLQQQAATPPAELEAAENKIQALLKKSSLNDQEVEELQDTLKSLGYKPGPTDGDMGTKTADAIMEYMKDNPEALLQASPGRLRSMMKYGQTDELRELARNNKEAFDARIQEQLDAFGPEGSEASLQNTTDFEAAYSLQTLLSIGGYNPGGLDGIVGGKTLRAVDRFGDRNDLPVIPQPKPEISRPTEDSTLPKPVEKPPIPQTNGSVAPSGFTRNYEGENGYGVSNLAIERTWAKITGDEVDQDLLRDYTDQSTPSAAGNPRPLIVIDLGHGSDIGSNNKIDSGAVSNISGYKGLSEVGVVDPVSQAMAEKLHAMGYQVAFTRNPGEQLRVEGTHGQTLRVRPDFAHALSQEVGANGVVFISMHANSFSKASANGGRIYVDIDGAKVANTNSNKLGSTIAESYDVRDKDSSVRTVGDLSVIDRFDNRANGIDAGVLVELGFLSNRKDAAALKEMSENPDETATEIVSGINKYVQQAVPELQTTPTLATKAEPAPTNG